MHLLWGVDKLEDAVSCKNLCHCSHFPKLLSCSNAAHDLCESHACETGLCLRLCIFFRPRSDCDRSDLASSGILEHDLEVVHCLVLSLSLSLSLFFFFVLGLLLTGRIISNPKNAGNFSRQQFRPENVSVFVHDCCGDHFQDDAVLVLWAIAERTYALLLFNELLCRFHRAEVT